MTQPCYVSSIFNHKHYPFFTHYFQTCVTSVFFSFCVWKKSPTKRGMSIKMLNRKVPMRIKSIYICLYIELEGEKNRPGRWTTLYSMNNVQVSETKTLILMKPRVVVFRFRITKWPTGMPYRTHDYWLPSVLFLSSIPVFYSRYISRTWLPFTYAERGCWRSITRDKDFLLLLLGGTQRNMFE